MAAASTANPRRFEQAATATVASASVLALGMMLYVSAHKSITLDESITLARTTPPLGKALHDLFVESQKPPVYFLLVYALRRVAPSLEAVRLFSMAAILALFLVLDRLARRLALARDWRSPVLLAAVTPTLLWSGADARFYAMTALLLALSTGFFLRLWVQDTDRPWRDGAGFVVINYLALLTFYYAAFVIAGQFVAAAASRRWKRLFAAGAALTVLMLPWLPLILGQAGNYARAPMDEPHGVPAASVIGNLVLLVRGASWSLFRDPPAIHRAGVLITIVLLLLAIIVAALALPDRARPSNLKPLAIIGAVSLAITWLMRVWNRYRVEDRHWMILAPVFILLIASLADRIRVPLLRRSLWLALLGVFGLCAVSFARNDHGPRDYRTAVDFLAGHERPGEPIVFYWSNPMPYQYYYTGANPLLALHPRHEPGGGVSLTDEEAAALRAMLARPGTDQAFWVFEESSRIETSRLVFPPILGYPLRLLSENHFMGLRLLRFEPAGTAP